MKNTSQEQALGIQVCPPCPQVPPNTPAGDPEAQSMQFISGLALQPHHTNPSQHLPLWITDSLLCRCSRARTIW